MRSSIRPCICSLSIRTVSRAVAFSFSASMKRFRRSLIFLSCSSSRARKRSSSLARSSRICRHSAWMLIRFCFASLILFALSAFRIWRIFIQSGIPAPTAPIAAAIRAFTSSM